MYNVLIVDDEPWIANGIKKLVDWESLGFTVVGEAFDGIAALEFIENNKPDVVISDIRMPGLDGIELLEQINLKKLDIKVILVSGYAEFDLAQKAVRFGAFDYLLKQIDKNKLFVALTRLEKVLTKNRKGSGRGDTLLEDLFEILNPDSRVKIGDFMRSRGVNTRFPHYRLISCIFPAGYMPDSREEILTNNELCLIRMRTGLNKLTMLVNYNDNEHPEFLDDFVMSHISGAESIGVSSVHTNSVTISKMFLESDIALYSELLISGDKVREYKTADLSKVFSKTALDIETAIKEHKIDCIYKHLGELRKEFKSGGLQIDQIAAIYNHVAALLCKYYPKANYEVEIEYVDYYRIINHYGSIDQLMDDLKIYIEKKISILNPIPNEFVKRILDFIDANYMQNIMLIDLSQKFNISMGYLSMLIKKETGRNYSEHIIMKRLNLAKELLKDEKLTINDVVQRIGYTDYYYFNKLFKKYMGITPGKYKKDLNSI
jgi:two-component system response regulator YesN